METNGKVLLTISLIFVLAAIPVECRSTPSSFADERPEHAEHLPPSMAPPISSGPRIINGTVAEWEGTRYQVSLRLKVLDWFFGSGHICGGSLIARDVVLTAAHCLWDYKISDVRNASQFSVVLGNLDRYVDDNDTLTFNVSRIAVPEGFNISTYQDDLAVLFLEGAVPEGFARALPIELSERTDLASGTGNGTGDGNATMCTVSGWGRTETSAYASELMLVEVPIVGRDECASNYGDFLGEGMLCAGYMEGSRDACYGDSGGPLVCEERLVGVVSYGNECALPGYPGVYTDVAAHAAWIRDVTKANKASTSTMATMTTVWFGLLPLLLWIVKY